PTPQESLIQLLGLEQRMRPTTRRTLAGSMRHPQRVTRDLRQRQLPTVPSHAVPTRECQSDPPSLLRTLRCSRPRGQPIYRASPLDLLLHVSTRIGMKGPALYDERRRHRSSIWEGYELPRLFEQLRHETVRTS